MGAFDEALTTVPGNFWKLINNAQHGRHGCSCFYPIEMAQRCFQTLQASSAESVPCIFPHGAARLFDVSYQ